MAMIDVIKYEGDNSTFIWQSPVENFNTKSQLIVEESQEAIFFMNGQALDLFGPGRHTLTTENIPLLRNLLGLATGGADMFTCKVYFINRAMQMEMKWGTDSKVSVTDPKYDFTAEIGASGSMALVPEDSRKLLVKLLGSEKTLTRDTLIQKFRGILMAHVKSMLGPEIENQGVSLFKINNTLLTLSEKIGSGLKPVFEAYGIRLESFVVSMIVLPEDDPQFQQFKQINNEAGVEQVKAKRDSAILTGQSGNTDLANEIRRKNDAYEMERARLRAETIRDTTILEAQGEAAKRQLEGYTYQQERSFDMAEQLAGNDAVSSVANLGVGLGAAVGVGSFMSGALKNSLGDAQSAMQGAAATQDTLSDPGKSSSGGIRCAKCGTELPAGAKFCFGCGEKVVSLKPGECICPSCGGITPKGKFCMQCGAPMVKTCKNCGKEIPEGGKFCLECGTKAE